MSENNDALSTMIDDKILFGMDNLVNKMKTKNTSIEDMLSNKSEKKESPKIPSIKEHIPMSSPFINETSEPVWTAPKVNMDELSNKSIGKDDFLFEKIKTPSMGNNIEPDINILNPIIQETNEEEYIDKVSDKIEVKSKDDIINIADLLGEWEDLAKKNKNMTLKEFDIHSDPDEIKFEIKKIRARKSREKATRYMTIIVLIMAKSFEAISRKIKLINVNITGWSSSLKHNMDDFEDIFADLYEVHFSSGSKKSPILRLIQAFLFSALNFYIMNQGAEMMSDFINNKTNIKKTTYRNMTPPDEDLETEELLADLK